MPTGEECWQDCPVCGGSGWIQLTVDDGPECPNCKGEGVVPTGNDYVNDDALDTREEANGEA